MADPAAAQHPDDNPAISARNARYGLILFAVYLALYGGFVALNAFNPAVMAVRTFVGGANLALVYGVGLIVAALILSFVYMFLCRGNTRANP